MYFIVYIEKLNQNFILPATWIKNIELHFEKFMNRSINRTQVQLCYYTTNADAFESNNLAYNCPRKEWSASFIKMVDQTIDGQPFDGCFYGFLQHFNVKFDDAVDYIKKHRNQRPHICNPMRQLEHPLPDLEVEGNDNLGADDSQRLNTSSNSNEVRKSFENNVDEVEVELSALNGINGTSHIDATQTDPLNDSEIDIKPDPLTLFEENRDLFENLLTDTTELDTSDSSDEIIFSNDFTVFPKPIKCDAHDLIKRENDEMSGNISCNEKDGDRIYRVSENLIQIPGKVISQIIEWNRNKRDEIKLDLKIFGSLFLCLMNPEDLKKGVVHDCIMDFIRKCFEVRCPNAVDRIKAIETYKTDLLKKVQS